MGNVREAREHGHCPYCDTCVPAFFDVLVRGRDAQVSEKITVAYAVRFQCHQCGGEIVAERNPTKPSTMSSGASSATSLPPRGIH